MLFAGQAVESLVEAGIGRAHPLGRSIVDDASTADHDNVIGDGFDFLQDVRGEQYRFGAAEVTDQLADISNLIGIETRRRLVHYENVGLVKQYLRHSDALAVAFGELGDLFFQNLAERTFAGDSIDPAVQPLAAKTSRFAEKAKQAERRHIGIKRAIFRQVTQARGACHAFAGNIETADARFTGARSKIPGKQLHCCRLACPVRSQERADLASRNAEADVAHGGEAPVELGEADGLNHRCRAIAGAFFDRLQHTIISRQNLQQSYELRQIGRAGRP